MLGLLPHVRVAAAVARMMSASVARRMLRRSAAAGVAIFVAAVRASVDTLPAVRAVCAAARRRASAALLTMASVVYVGGAAFSGLGRPAGGPRGAVVGLDVWVRGRLVGSAVHPGGGGVARVGCVRPGVRVPSARRTRGHGVVLCGCGPPPPIGRPLRTPLPLLSFCAATGRLSPAASNRCFCL